MREQYQSPSLLSYLTPRESGVGLEIALPSEDPQALAHYSFPFLLVSDADPLSRLVRAAFVTDSGSKIEDVFLLVQRDEYAFAANQLAPLTNVDVEGFWQRTHQVHAHRKDGSPLITLQHQCDDQGNLVPFQSLFFCRSTGIYFHPPCPSCGVALQLCSNDHLLDSIGLPRYTLSLKRYLFCPTCFASGHGTDFFAYHKDALDPPLVKDWADLLRAFGQLLQERKGSSGLPCLACPQNEQCYGPGATSIPPMVAFSFYPFYMMIHEGMSVNGWDFLAMVGGASTEELAAWLTKAGRMGRAFAVRSFKPGQEAPRPFLFDDDPRLFLEVLYLKLTFLGQIVADLFPESGRGKPDPLRYLDRIWVKLTDRSGLLPYLWNSELNYLDLVRDPLDLPCHPQMPPAYALHLLGLIWFVVLLTNRNQDVAEVQRAVEHAQGWEPPEDSIGSSQLTAEPAFLPGNIFWNPTALKLTESWSRIWEEVLGLGWSLLRSSREGDSSDFREELIGAVAHLRANLKRELFLESAAGNIPGQSTEAQAIHDILSRLAARCREPALGTPEEEWEKTIALPGGASFEETLPPGEISETVVLAPSEAPRPAVAVAEEEIFQETVILSGKGVSDTFRSDETPALKADAELSETVILGATGARLGRDAILSPASLPATAAEAKGSEELPEELAETVILKPFPRREDRAPTSDGPATTTPSDAAAEEILPETVILSPSGRLQPPPRVPSGHDVPEGGLEPSASPPVESEAPEAATAKKPKPGEEDDLLSATIILTPSKDRDKK